MKLNLDFALYKGKTRLREWWEQVKAHFIEVQEAVNDLDDAQTGLSGAIDGLQTDIKNEVRQREMLDERVTTDIEDMGQIIMLPDEGGVFNATDTESISNAPQERLFKLYNDTGAELKTMQSSSDLWPLTSALPAGAECICMKSNINGKHRILVLADNIATTEDIINALKSYYTSTEIDRIIEGMQSAIDELKESAAGGGMTGTLATEEMIREMMKNATPDVYVPDGITIGLATDEQVKGICNE